MPRSTQALKGRNKEGVEDRNALDYSTHVRACLAPSGLRVFTRRLAVPGRRPGLASISTVLEVTNGEAIGARQVKRMSSCFPPNQGIGVGVSASPEETR